MKKRLFSILLCAVLLLALLPAASAKAAEDKLIALTFDDGPGEDTMRLLDGLRERGVKCTFFILGKCARLYPEAVKRCYEDGHQVASHTYSHSSLPDLSDDEIRSEVSRTESAIADILGFRMRLFVRPPYGNHNSRVLSALGVPAVYWSDDSGDWWSGATAQSVFDNTMEVAGDGDILLLHDSHSWSVDAALMIVDALTAEGYEFVTVSELFRRRGVEPGAGGIYCWCRQNGTNLPGISAPRIRAAKAGACTVVNIYAEPGTEVRYTLDGTVPTPDSPVYTGPLVIANDTVFNAVAGYDMNGSRSDRTTRTIRIFTKRQKPAPGPARELQ